MSRFDLFYPVGGPRSIIDLAPTAATDAGARPGELRRGPSYEEIARAELGGSVRLTDEARAALRLRGREPGAVELDQIGVALDRLARHGAREGAVLTEQTIFVVRVVDRTVLRALDRADLREDVLGDIDSAIEV